MTTALPIWTRSDGSELQLSRGEPYLTEAGISEPFTGIQAADLHFARVEQAGDLHQEPWCN
jgi:hypothetical protein